MVQRGEFGGWAMQWECACHDLVWSKFFTMVVMSTTSGGEQYGFSSEKITTLSAAVFHSFDAGLPPFVTYLRVYERPGALVQILRQASSMQARSSSTAHPQPSNWSIPPISGPPCRMEPQTDRSPSPREWHIDQQQGVHCAPIDRPADAPGNEKRFPRRRYRKLF